MQREGGCKCTQEVSTGHVASVVFPQHFDKPESEGEHACLRRSDGAIANNVRRYFMPVPPRLDPVLLVGTMIRKGAGSIRSYSTSHRTDNEGGSTAINAMP